LAIALYAQEAGVQHVGGGVTQPRLLMKGEPEYSDEARMAGIDAVVGVALIVGENGIPRDLKVSRGAGFGLDENAIEAVAHWRFSPAMKADAPVAVKANVDVTFKLLGLGTSARLVFELSGASRPVLQSGRLAGLLGPAPATFHFTFDVNQQGGVDNLRCAEPGADIVLEALRKFKFQPATANGQPVRVPASLELSYK